MQNILINLFLLHLASLWTNILVHILFNSDKNAVNFVECLK